MHKIDGISEEEIIETIIKVCNRCKNKYKIDGMCPEDIFQESYIICIERLNKYDGRTTLENFLAFVLCRRLKNLYRNITNKKINCVSIDKVPEDLLWKTPENNTKEFTLIINEKLTVDMRHDYIKYIQGVFIPRVRKQRLIKELKRLANEF